MLKSFDFFRKIQTDQELTSATGGIFTFIAIIIATLLIFMSLTDFYQQKYYTFLSIKNDDSEFLPMRIDIIFFKLPCQAMAIQFKDELENVEHSLESKVTMFSVKRNEQKGEIYKRSENRGEELGRLKKNIEEVGGCRVTGILPLPKTPGTLIFGFSGQSNLIHELPHQLKVQTRMNYRLDSLNFGLGNNTFDFPIAHKSKNIQTYIKDLQGDINSRTFIQDLQKQTQNYHYYNHIKIIPVVIESSEKTQADSFQKYRFSYRSGQALSFQPLQQVYFLTEIEPINIVYKKHEPSIYELIRSLLAIVGGTVATIGIFNSLSHFVFGIK